MYKINPNQIISIDKYIKIRIKNVDCVVFFNSVVLKSFI